MDATTIKIYQETKSKLDRFREHKSESYDDVIKKVVYIAEHVRTEPALSRQTLKAIDQARERFRRGEFVTEAEAKRRLGL
jgi:predicted transcriptional regulator